MSSHWFRRYLFALSRFGMVYEINLAKILCVDVFLESSCLVWMLPPPRQSITLLLIELFVSADADLQAESS